MRRFLSGILYLAVGLPITLSALLVFAVKPWVSDKDFYKKALTDDRLYALVSDPLSWKNVDPIIVQDGYRIDTRALASGLQKKLPVPELKDLAGRAVDELFDALGPAPSDHTVDLDLRPLKRRMALAIPDIARGYIAALPVKEGTPGTSDLSFRPSSISVPAAEKLTRSAFEKVLASIPDSLAEPVRTPNVPKTGRIGIIRFNPLSAAPAATGLAFAASLIIAALSFLGSSRGAERLRRAGKYIMIPSVLVMLAGALLYLPGAPALRALLPPEMAQILSSANGATLSAYLASIFGPLAQSLFLTGLVGSSIGGALISSRRIIEPKEN